MRPLEKESRVASAGQGLAWDQGQAAAWGHLALTRHKKAEAGEQLVKQLAAREKMVSAALT